MVAVSLKKKFFQAEDGIRDIRLSDWSSDVCSSDLCALYQYLCQDAAGKVSFVWDCNPESVSLQTFNCFYTTKIMIFCDMTKPRLGKVRALFYVFQQVMTGREMRVHQNFDTPSLIP